MTTFVLVHGAWHGGWCWRKVTPLLRAAGHGQALVDLIGPEGRQYLEARVRTEGDGWRLPSIAPVPWEVVVREIWAITNEADARWMVERLGPQPFKTMTEPVRCTNATAAA